MSLRQANFWHFPSQDYQSHPAHSDKNIPEKAGIAELLKVRKTRSPCALVAVGKKNIKCYASSVFPLRFATVVVTTSGYLFSDNKF
ncbi:hypothetical protein SAMN05428978_102216 [Nitrosomonas sp. Nm34]|nr:hypothetical protein SAMN05428978_102216 [Nitrosomonas sp. Nm34]